MYCYIEGYGNKKFHIDTGCVYNFEFNEKLDSFNMVISNCDTDITFTKFQYFKVLSDEQNTFSLTMILDNYTKRIVNLNGTQKFQYTISLMSETKLLEKIKCPNRQILHSLVNGHRTLLEVIRQVCELYIPRVKKATSDTTWGYDYAIDWHNIFDALNNEPVDYFSNVECPDISFTKTSLRDVLTTLMLVVGCIPVVRNRTLGCMNLRAIPTNFNVIDNRILEIQQSNSSDSFTTTLRNPIKSVLDTNNIVRNEVIGFRDSENVFLKQQENLILTTNLNIEKVNKLTLKVYSKTKYRINRPTGQALNYAVQLNANGTILNFVGMPIDTQYPTTIEFYMLDQPYLQLNQDQEFSGKPKYVQTINVPLNTTTFDLRPYAGTYSFFLVRGRALPNGPEVVRTSLMQTSHNTYIDYFLELKGIDLTPIVKEKQERSALDVDYTNIPTAIVSGDTIDVSPLASSYYTTLEYTYNKNTIKGFSNHWDRFEWYGDQESTFLDVLQSYIPSNYQSTYIADKNATFESMIYSYYLLNETHISGITYTKTSETPTVYPDYIRSDIVKYSCSAFELEYIPFNELVVEHSKTEDLPIEFTEFDTQESSIIMLDEFSAREIDKVNRLGNDVLQAQQLMTNSFAGVQPLNSLLNGSIVFSVSMEIYENLNQANNTYNRFINVSYVATKNYVLKNYFTALQNKYRAYEYSDDSSATLRQELHKTYVCVGFDRLINGSDIIRSSTYRFLISTLIADYEPLKYVVIGDYSFEQISDSYKYDLSIVGGNDYIAISHVEPYTNHYGIIIDQNKSELESSLGGYIQRWLPHSSTYKTRHRLGYTRQSALYQPYVIGDTNLLDLNAVVETPKIHLIEDDYIDNFEFYLRNKTSISDDTSSYNINYYSNAGERLSDVVQLTYYSLSPHLKISKNFTQYNRLSVNNNYTLYLRQRDNNSLNEEWYDSTETVIRNYNAFEFESYNGGIALLIRNLSAYEDYYGVITLHDNDTNKDLDLFNIKLSDGLNDSGNLYLNFSLNDTKTLRVYRQNSTGIWELDRKVKMNNNARETETI